MSRDPPDHDHAQQASDDTADDTVGIDWASIVAIVLALIVVAIVVLLLLSAA